MLHPPTAPVDDRNENSKTQDRAAPNQAPKSGLDEPSPDHQLARRTPPSNAARKIASKPVHRTTTTRSITLAFHSISELTKQETMIRTQPYGIIDVFADGQIQLRFRPWPTLIRINRLAWTRFLPPNKRQQNHCRLFFNQPRHYASFLALKYVESTPHTTMAAFRLTLKVLDEIARIKGSDAIVAHVTNRRISDRLLNRWGWEQHLKHKPTWNNRSRHFIKRFYGQYPP